MIVAVQQKHPLICGKTGARKQVPHSYHITSNLRCHEFGYSTLKRFPQTTQHITQYFLRTPTLIYTNIKLPPLKFYVNQVLLY